jgi:DNA polymerase eta
VSCERCHDLHVLKNSSNPLRTIAHCDIDAAYARTSSHRSRVSLAEQAEFESVRLGLPDDIPLICAQWQSIIAVNYPARKFGIKRSVQLTHTNQGISGTDLTRFNTIDESKRMCPHLYVQHVATYRNGESEAGYWGEVDPATHKVGQAATLNNVQLTGKVSLDPYRRESLKILAIFKEMVPKGEIGQLIYLYLHGRADDIRESFNRRGIPRPYLDGD